MSGKIENTLKMFSLNKEYLLIIVSQETDNKLLNLSTEVVIKMILKHKNYQMYKLQNNDIGVISNVNDVDVT